MDLAFQSRQYFLFWLGHIMEGTYFLYPNNTLKLDSDISLREMEIRKILP